MLVNQLVDPYTKEDLKIISFDKGNTPSNGIENGILINEKNFSAYPIISKVPILLKNYIPENFYQQYKTFIDPLFKDIEILKKQLLSKANTFSFSSEWEQFHKDKMCKTWGFTAEERLIQFFEETKTSREEIKGKLILDAGSGNGLLTKAIAEQGAYTIGIDYSDSVFNIASTNQNPNLLYIKGDLNHPPFKDETFDVIISNGVIHHTKSTENAFTKVAALVKRGGKFYVWLYRRPLGFYMNTFMYSTDFLRFIVNKLPSSLQKAIVNLYTFFFYHLKKIKNKNVMEFDQLRIDAYDTLTPEYKHYHNPIEVAKWFHENGFESPLLSHWDNPYGFGIMSVKNPKEQTPGINFKIRPDNKQF